jgi:membrane protease YdiL (CAAX protease family)
VVTLLSVWVILVRPVLPSELRFGGGLVVAGCTVAIGLWAGLDADGLGVSPHRLTDGLRYGGLAFGAVTVVLLLGLAIPLTRHGFHSSRADITGGQLVLQALVTIPLGTVVVEELAFRGVLLGLLRQAKPTASAVVACSVLFGLWHVPTVLRAASGSDALVLAAAAGTFVATFAAGLAFCWLRIRSGSLLAPALAHLATNTVALTVAWFVVQ